MNTSAKLCAVALLAASTWSLSAPAGAAPITAPLSLQNATSSIETVQWRGWGWGVGAGVAAGLIVGGAIAASQYPYYGYGYGPYPYGYYAPAPVYAAPPVYGAPGPVYGAQAPVAGDAVAYCSRRYRSYDPASGTFLGYDGQRHPCP
jgi:hypothetical protein